MEKKNNFEKIVKEKVDEVAEEQSEQEDSSDEFEVDESQLIVNIGSAMEAQLLYDDESDYSDHSSESGQEGEIEDVEIGIENALQEEDEESSDEDEIFIPKKMLSKNITKDYRPITAVKSISHFEKITKGTEIGNKWVLGNLLREDSNIQIYNERNPKYSVKIARNKEGVKLLENELKIIKEISEFTLLPKVGKNYSGKNEELKILFYSVMKWDGSTLLSYSKSDEILPLNVDQIVLNILDGIQWLHENNILFIDFNLLHFSYPKNNMVKFVDFTYAQKCYSKKEGKKCSGTIRESKYTVVGSPDYISLNIQRGGIATYYDDIESFLYLILGLGNKGKLPWDDLERRDIILEKTSMTFSKKDIRIHTLINYVRKSKGDINYNYIEDVLTPEDEEDEEDEFLGDDEFFNKGKSEQQHQYKFRILLYKLVKNTNLSEIINDGNEYEFSDEVCFKITRLLFNKLWFNINYDENTEYLLEKIYTK